MIFSRNHTAIDLNSTDNHFSPYQMSRLTHIFGSFVTNLRFQKTELLNEPQTQKLFDLIVENCSAGALKSLSVAGISLDLSAPGIRQFFRHLIELNMENCQMMRTTSENSFTDCKNMLRLKIDKCENVFKFVSKNCFPNLEALELQNVKIPAWQEDRDFSKLDEYLAHHKALREVILLDNFGHCCYQLANIIAINLPLLEKFQINIRGCYSHLMPLLRYQHINRICWIVPYSNPAYFFENMVWVESVQYLKLGTVAIDYQTFPTIDRFRNLRELEIESAGFSGSNIQFELLKNLGQLTKLIFSGESWFEKSDIINLVVALRKLTVLKLCMLDPILDEVDIDKLRLIGRSRNVELTVIDSPIEVEDIVIPRFWMEIERELAGN